MLIDLKDISLREDEEGVWIASSPLLPGCHAWGSTRDEAALKFQDAAKAHLEALKDSGRPIPAAFRAKFALLA